MSNEKVLTEFEFLELVEEMASKYPVLKQLKDLGYRKYEDWHQNIKDLIDKELGIERRTIIVQKT